MVGMATTSCLHACWQADVAASEGSDVEVMGWTVVHGCASRIREISMMRSGEGQPR